MLTPILFESEDGLLAAVKPLANGTYQVAVTQGFPVWRGIVVPSRRERHEGFGIAEAAKEAFTTARNIVRATPEEDLEYLWERVFGAAQTPESVLECLRERYGDRLPAMLSGYLYAALHCAGLNSEKNRETLMKAFNV